MRDRLAQKTDVWAAGTLAFVVAFWLVDLGVIHAGIADPLDDSWEYGAVARALLAGQGFRTPVIHPPLWTLRDALGHVPVLVHGPLLPMLMMPWVAIFGQHALDGIAWLAALFATLAAITTFRLAARTLSPGVGAGAAMLVTLSPLMLRAVHHDIALALGAWLLVQAVSELMRIRPHAARAALLLAIGALVRPEFLLASPVLFWQARAARGRFALVAAIALLPWAWHGLLHTGSPFFNLSSYLLIGYWGPRPGIGVMRDFTLPPHEWLAMFVRTLPSLPLKWISFAPHALKSLLGTPSAATGWLAPIGAFGAVQGVRSRNLAQTSLALAVVPWFVMSVTLYDPRYLAPFLPLFAIGAANGASEVCAALPRWGQRPATSLVLLLALLLPSTLPAILHARLEARAAEAQLVAERAALKVQPRARLAFSDTPDLVAWTTSVPTVWVTREEYLKLPLAGADIAPADRPERHPGADLTWFHAGEGRGAALPAAGAGGAADSTRGRKGAPADSAHAI